MTEERALDASVLHSRIARALASCIDAPESGKPWTDTIVAAELGISPRTVKSHRLGQSPPNVAAMWGYMRLLGPDFAAEVLPLAGLYGAMSLKDGDICPHESLAKTAEWAAKQAAVQDYNKVPLQTLAETITDARRRSSENAAFSTTLEKIWKKRTGEKWR